MMNELSAFLRNDKPQDPIEDPVKTRYAIRLICPEVWYVGNGHWETESTSAVTFEFMTTANWFAVSELALSPLDYTVEAV